MKHIDDETDRELTPQEQHDLADEAFTWWASLDAPATRGTQRGDWKASLFRDAVCFQRRGSQGDDAYMVRGTHVTHFGLNDDSLEDIYEAMVRVDHAVHHHAGFLAHRMHRRRRGA